MNTKISFRIWAAMLFCMFVFQKIQASSSSNNDVGLKTILSPVNNSCGDSFTKITVIINNIGINSQSKIPVVINISGSMTATYSDTLFKTLSSGGVDTFSFITTINTFSGGTYTLKAYTALSTDQDATNDTITASVTILPTPVNPVTTGASGCGYTSLVLKASTPPSGATNYWYTSPSSFTSIASGDSFKTPYIATTTTYYVSSSYGMAGYVGALDKSIGAGGNLVSTTNGLHFHAYSDFIIDSITVYPNDTGTHTVGFKVRDSITRKTVDSVIVTYTMKTAGSAIRIPIGIKITAGRTYYAVPEHSNCGGLFRNTAGISFPYNLPGVVSIRSGVLNTTRYYFFYKWRVIVPGCYSKKIPVTATITTGSKPTVKFSATNSCAGVASTFTDNSSASSGTTLTNYKYDFGDGNIYTSTTSGNTTHTYSTPGTYKILYYVTSSNGCTDTVSAMVKIDSASNADFNTSGTCSGLVTFTDVSKKYGSISTYSYDFGDTSTYSSTTTGSTTHTYKYTGAHNVKFNFTTAAGCSYSITKTVTTLLSPNAPGVTGTTGCGVGIFTLKASKPVTGAQNYWFSSSTGGSPIATGDSFVTPVINSTTTYYVEQSSVITGYVGPLNNSIGAGANYTASAGLRFHAYTDFIIDSITVYPNASGRVYFNLRDSGSTTLIDSVSVAVTVTTAGNPIRVYVGMKIPSQTKAYTLDADGTTTGGLYRNSAGTKFPYVLPGIVTITNSKSSNNFLYFFYNWKVSSIGCSSSRTAVTATITSGSLPKIKNTVMAYCAGTPIVILDSSTAPSGGSIAKYYYQFGDGYSLTTTSKTVAHTYSAAGTYKIITMVTTAAGCSDTMSKLIIISPAPKSGVGITGLCSGSSATFSDKSTYGGTLSNIFINFGDTSSTNSSTSPVTHTYKYPGTYKVVYKITSSAGCIDSTITTVTVTQTPLSPTVTGASSCSSPAILKLAAKNSLTNSSNLWYNASTGGSLLNIGDTLITPSISSSTTYYVKSAVTSYGGSVGKLTRGALAVNTNNTNGLRFKVYKEMLLDSLIMYPRTSGSFYIRFTDSTSGKNDSVAVSVTVTTANQLKWIRINRFFTSGTYYIRPIQPTTGGTGGFSRDATGAAFPYKMQGVVSILSNTLASTTAYYYFYDWRIDTFTCESNRVPVTALIGGGNSIAKFYVTKACEGGTIGFTDSSSAIKGSITGYGYDFGDGKTYSSTTTGNTSHVYTKAGTYKAVLTIYNSTGCNDTTSRMVTVLAYPQPKIIASTSCEGSATNFNYTSNGSISQSWSFGDGNTSTSASPNNTYSKAGSYTVKVVVSNGYCPDSTTTTVTVHPLPVAKISANNGCVNTPLSFSDVSTVTTGYIAKHSWDFADGSALDSNANPTHTYSKAGNYSVNLTAITDKGCTQNTSKLVTIDNAPVAKIDTTRLYTNGFTFKSRNAADFYAWDFGDGTYDTAKQVNHVFSIAKTYWVKLITTSANKCFTSDSMQISVVTGANEISLKGVNAEVSPNPFRDEFNLSLQLNHSSKVKIYITDVTGKMLGEVENTSKVSGTYYYHLNSAEYGLSKGVYLLHIDAGGEHVLKKLIKFN